MGQRSLAEFEDLIAFEVRRTGWVPGLDAEEVAQELRAHVAMKCLPKITGNRGRSFVRTSVRNALANLKRAATTVSRMPRDARGKMLPPLALDWQGVDADADDDGQPAGTQVRGALPTAPGPSPERAAEDRMALHKLDERLTSRERDLLMSAFVEGVVARGDERKVAKARARARQILTTVLENNQHRVTSDDALDVKPKETTTMTIDISMIPKTPTDQLPDCHTGQADEVGYETDLAEAEDCQDCPDKFTCLPTAIDSGLIEASLDIDPEVAAVLAGYLTHKDAMDRLRRRQQIRENGGTVPAELLFDNVSAGDEEAEEPTEEEVETAAEGDDEMEEVETAAEGDDEMEETEAEAAPPPPAKKASKAKAKKTSNGKAKAAPKKASSKKAAPKKASSKKAAPKKASSKKASSKKAAPKKASSKKAAPKKTSTRGKTAKKAAAKKKAPPKPEIDDSGNVTIGDKILGTVEEVEGEGWGWWAGDDESPDWYDSQADAIAGLVKAKGPRKRKGGGRRRSSVDASEMEVGTVLEDGRMVCASGRIAPAPKDLNKDQLVRALERTTLGLPFDLAPGMKLIHTRRDGETVEIQITSKGFKYDGQNFPSLTAACMRATKRSVSGNDMFNFEKHSNIEIKGKGVPGGSFTRDSAE